MTYWSTPYTWVHGETEDAAGMNLRIRDNLTVLGGTHTFGAGSYPSHITPDGIPRVMIKGVAYSGSANSNNSNVSTGNYAIPSFDVVIPAGFLAQPGDNLWCAYTCLSLAAGSGVARYVYASVDGGSNLSPLTNGITTVSHVIAAEYRIGRRTDSLLEIFGGYHYGAAAGGAPTGHYANGSTFAGTYSCAAGFTIKLYLSSTTANTLCMTEYFVAYERARYGDAGTLP